MTIYFDRDMIKKKLTDPAKLISLFIIFLFTSPAMVHANNNLKIGWEPWGIYQYQDADGNLQGLDVDLLSAITKAANYNLTWKKLPWKRHLMEIERGNVDVASGASKNKEREEYAYFSLPYRTESVVLFVRKGESHLYPFTNIKDIMLTEFRLGTTLGYDYGEAIAELMKNEEFLKHIQQVKEDSIHYNKIVRLRIDGFLGDTFATIEGLKKINLQNKVEKHPMSIYFTNIFIMLSKKTNTPEKVLLINKAIEEIKENGTYDRILDKYLK